jgi:hypothetical protein
MSIENSNDMSYRDQKWEICSFCSLDNVCEIIGNQKWEICSFCSLDNVCEIIGIRNEKYVHSVLLTMCVKLSGSEMGNMFILFSWQCVWNYRDQKWEICSFCSLDNVCEIVCITYCCLKLLFCVMFPLLFHVSTTVLSWLPLRFSLTLINQVLNITVILRL